MKPVQDFRNISDEMNRMNLKRNRMKTFGRIKWMNQINLLKD